MADPTMTTLPLETIPGRGVLQPGIALRVQRDQEPDPQEIGVFWGMVSLPPALSA